MVQKIQSGISVNPKQQFEFDANSILNKNPKGKELFIKLYINYLINGMKNYLKLKSYQQISHL
jgi:hypothetical protein